MQQFHGRPAGRDRKEEITRVNAPQDRQSQQDRRNSGEPAKFNNRSERQRISWENDLYERQSIWSMNDIKDQYIDLTEKASYQGDDGSTSRARLAESDDLHSGVLG